MMVSHKANKKFTLVELLVVIAIISVLAGFLLPALENAQDAAKQILCINNLKQVSIAFGAYETDYDGYLPSQTADTHYYHSYWMGLSCTYLGIDKDKAKYSWGNTPAGYTGYIGHADRYITVLQCPVRHDVNPWSGGNSYGVNPFYSMPWSGYMPMRRTSVRSPSSTYMLSDSMSYNTVYPGFLGRTCDPSHVRFAGVHGGGLNVIFSDGHAEWRIHGIPDSEWEYAVSGIIFRDGWRGAP